jgi:uncharacterized protein YndB with AHSA1/START domain
MGTTQQLFEAFSSSVRREILWAVWDDELAAGEICALFDLTAPTISQHLATMRDAGLVTMRVDGNFRRYRARHESVEQLQQLVLGPSTKWRTTDSAPEAKVPSSRALRAVEVSVLVGADRATVFRAFTDGELFSRWLGVPVSLVNDRFRCTMEFGTEVRGRYVHVIEPSFIAMSWDFADDSVPLPGGQQDGYLRLERAGRRTRVTMQQLAADDEQADYLDAAWRLVLGRLATQLHSALDVSSASTVRPNRRKQST